MLPNLIIAVNTASNIRPRHQVKTTLISSSNIRLKIPNVVPQYKVKNTLTCKNTLTPCLNVRLNTINLKDFISLNPNPNIPKDKNQKLAKIIIYIISYGSLFKTTYTITLG